MSNTALHTAESVVGVDEQGTLNKRAEELGVDVRRLGIDVETFSAAAQLATQFERSAGLSCLHGMLEEHERWARTMNPFGSLTLGLVDAAAVGLGRHATFSHDLVNSAFRESRMLGMLQHDRLQAREMAESLGLGRHAALGVHSAMSLEAALPHRLLAERMSVFESSTLGGLQQATLGLDAKGDGWGAIGRLARQFGLTSTVRETFDHEQPHKDGGAAARI